jgi:hypothetical protein
MTNSLKCYKCGNKLSYKSTVNLYLNGQTFCKDCQPELMSINQFYGAEHQNSEGDIKLQDVHNKITVRKNSTKYTIKIDKFELNADIKESGRVTLTDKIGREAFFFINSDLEIITKFKEAFIQLEKLIKSNEL